MPDSSNPQSLNRYSYVRNRPLNFNDPTGHMMDDGCNTEGCSLPAFNPLQTKALAQQQYYGYYLPCQQHGGAGCSAVATAIMNTKDAIDKVSNVVSNSSIGGQATGCIGGDIGVGLENCVTIQYMLGPRQIGIFVGVSEAGKVGIPNGLSVTGNAGLVIAPGASDLNSLKGPAIVAGVDGNLDPLFVKTGLYGQGSVNVLPYDSDGDGVNDTFRPLIDPITKMPITTESVGVQVGANAISTIVDGGGRVGASYTIGCVINLFPPGVTCR